MQWTFLKKNIIVTLLHNHSMTPFGIIVYFGLFIIKKGLLLGWADWDGWLEKMLLFWFYIFWSEILFELVFLSYFLLITINKTTSVTIAWPNSKAIIAYRVLFCLHIISAGYSYPVDWWSLGVVAYEMRGNIRPFVVHSNTPLAEIKNILNTPVHYPRYWSSNFVDLLQRVGWIALF